MVGMCNGFRGMWRMMGVPGSLVGEKVEGYCGGEYGGTGGGVCVECRGSVGNYRLFGKWPGYDSTWVVYGRICEGKYIMGIYTCMYKCTCLCTFLFV